MKSIEDILLIGNKSFVQRVEITNDVQQRGYPRDLCGADSLPGHPLTSSWSTTAFSDFRICQIFVDVFFKLF